MGPIWQIINVDQLGTTTIQNSQLRGNASAELSYGFHLDLTCHSGTLRFCSFFCRHRIWSTGPRPGRRAWRRWSPCRFLSGEHGIWDLPTDHYWSSDCPPHPVNRKEEWIQLGLRRYYSYIISEPILEVFLFHDEIVEKYIKGSYSLTKGLGWTSLWIIELIKGYAEEN